MVIEIDKSYKLVPSTEIEIKKVGKNTEFGTNDTFRNGLRSVKNEIEGRHPLEARIKKVFMVKKWDETRMALRNTIQRETGGSALVIQKEMEKYLIKSKVIILNQDQWNSMSTIKQFLFGYFERYRRNHRI